MLHMKLVSLNNSSGSNAYPLKLLINLLLWILLQTNAGPYDNASIDYSKDWIVDSGWSHHATGNNSLLSDVRPHYGKRAIVTADNSLHPIVKGGHFNVKKDVSNVGGVSLEDFIMF